MEKKVNQDNEGCTFCGFMLCSHKDAVNDIFDWPTPVLWQDCNMCPVYPIRSHQENSSPFPSLPGITSASWMANIDAVRPEWLREELKRLFPDDIAPSPPAPQTPTLWSDPGSETTVNTSDGESPNVTWNYDKDFQMPDEELERGQTWVEAARFYSLQYQTASVLVRECTPQKETILVRECAAIPVQGIHSFAVQELPSSEDSPYIQNHEEHINKDLLNYLQSMMIRTNDYPCCNSTKLEMQMKSGIQENEIQNKKIHKIENTSERATLAPLQNAEVALIPKTFKGNLKTSLTKEVKVTKIQDQDNRLIIGTSARALIKSRNKSYSESDVLTSMSKHDVIYSNEKSGNQLQHCSFCAKNGETEAMVMSHNLHYPGTNRVQCPILRKYKCESCSATGDFAHTRSYCPMVRQKEGTVRSATIALKSTRRQANGTLRNNNNKSDLGNVASLSFATQTGRSR